MTAKLNIYSVFYVGGFSKFSNVPDTVATLGINRCFVDEVDVFSVHVSRDVSRYRAIAKRLSGDRQEISVTWSQASKASVGEFSAPCNSATECEQRRLLSQMAGERRGVTQPPSTQQASLGLFTGVAIVMKNLATCSSEFGFSGLVLVLFCKSTNVE